MRQRGDAGTLVSGYEGNEIAFAVAGDLLFLVSLFILGGDFWDKLHSFHSRRESGTG